MRLKILLIILGVLLVGTGSYFAKTTIFNSEPARTTELVGFENPKSEATESAKPKQEEKREAKKPEGEVSGVIINTLVATSQQNTQTSKPDESGKIATLKNLLLKMTRAATNIHSSNQEVIRLFGEFAGLPAYCETLFPNITDPFSKERLISECIGTQSSLIQVEISVQSAVIDAALSDYRKWESQSGQIISSCSSTCTDIWNAYVKGLTSLGISLP